MGDGSVERERDHELRATREKASRYRGGRDPLDPTGKRVVVVDDGVATGSTAIAALRLVREGGAERVVLAVPVGPPGTVSELESVADAVIVLRTPGSFGAVGAFYDRFGQVTDEEAMTYLDDGI